MRPRPVGFHAARLRPAAQCGRSRCEILRQTVIGMAASSIRLLMTESFCLLVEGLYVLHLGYLERPTISEMPLRIVAEGHAGQP